MDERQRAPARHGTFCIPLCPPAHRPGHCGRRALRHPPRAFSLPQRGSSLAGKAYWAMVQRVALTAAAIDVGYILLFLWLGSVPLAAINAVSIAMYLGAYGLIQKRYNAPALVLIWTEVVAHAALGSLLIGWNSGFHYYLLLFIPAIVIANTRGFAAPVVLALLAYYLGLQALCDHLGPLDPLPAQSVKIVNWIHICLVFAMSAALAAFYRRTILIAESRLRTQATRDPLTGLANRSHFQAQATQALARSQRDGTPVALLLCDVDHFKRINDQHGHAVGDEVLVAMAGTLGENLREGDVLARWGGEEFLALMPASPLDAACATAERIRAVVAQAPLPVGSTPIALTLSFGVALVHGADDLQAAIARADKALYESKHAGRNRVSRG
ncbi:GGDEF domain-containing protein [Acidovorax sp. FJL06]|uniref:GGDEF domain-containing protein n=1 Tax=Acidovorax sp. FJL06 TaxID=2153365 RepID=UPI001F38A773|nr:GGDEF domain-containing protein [Acidovorax sp. FJL06]